MDPRLPTSWIGELTGQSIGPYSLVELLGQGSVGFVYKALQPALNRYVAIKVLPPHFLYASGFRERFQQETERVARLDHPHILPIFDFGHEDDVPYLVMPLVQGRTLSAWLDQPIPLDRALDVVQRLLSALEYAHTQEPPCVHRAIRPGNILLREDAWPLLTDFGLTHIIDAALRLPRPRTARGLLEYVAPEQRQGSAGDHRGDLYSMGVLLTKLIPLPAPAETLLPEGVPPSPFTEQTVSSPNVDPALVLIWEEVLQRSVAENSADRYPSAQAMNEAIAQARRLMQDQSARSPPDLRRLQDLQAEATEALAQGDWSRTIRLCSEALRVEPTHPEALHLLTEAHTALRRQHAQAEGRPTDELKAPTRPTRSAMHRDTSTSPARLTHCQDAETEVHYPLVGSVISIGRTADNTIQLQDSAVSRRHCQIRRTAHGYVLEDLGSRNGTHVNGSRVHMAELSFGDQIRVGDTVLQFNAGGAV